MKKINEENSIYEKNGKYKTIQNTKKAVSTTLKNELKERNIKRKKCRFTAIVIKNSNGS